MKTPLALLRRFELPLLGRAGGPVPAAARAKVPMWRRWRAVSKRPDRVAEGTEA